MAGTVARSVLLAVLLSAGGAARAQEEVRPTPTRPAESRPIATAPSSRPRLDPKEIRFDRVLATYGDFVVTESMIRDDVSRLLRDRPGGFQAANDSLRDGLQRQRMQIAIRDEIEAQAAKTLSTDPADLEKLLEKAWEREVKQKTSEAGSSTGLMARLQEMGLTWEQYQDEWRTSTLKEVYLDQEVRQKFFGREQTQVTPSEIRAYYRLHPDEFRSKESAEVEGVQVPAGRQDAIAGAGRALEALAQGKSTELAAAAAGGTVLPKSVYSGIGPDSPHHQRLKEFTSTHKTGETGGPIEVGENLLVLRVLRRLEGKQALFSDPGVQEHIVGKIKNVRVGDYRMKLLDEQRRKAFYWPEDLFGGR